MASQRLALTDLSTKWLLTELFVDKKKESLPFNEKASERVWR
jgi:hypothetical protein